MFSPKRKTLFLYFFSAFCFFLCVFALFGPILVLTTTGGESVALFGFPLIFGGTAEYRLPSGVYSYTFGLSVFMLVLTQCFLLGGVSCLLGKKSRFNRIASILLVGAGIVMTCMAPHLLCEWNSLPMDGVTFGGSLYLILFLGVVGIVLEILYGVFSTANPAKPESISEKNEKKR